jgi:hypothetical protein
MTIPLVFKVDRQWQIDCITCAARIMFLFAGRGAGKTSCVGRVRLVLHCLTNIDNLCVYLAPTYAIAKREYKALSKQADLQEVIVSCSEVPVPTITFTTGSKLTFRSLDRGDNLLGQHPNFMVIDEVQSIEERFFDSILRPQLGAHRGSVLAMGQFCTRGKSGWLYKRFYLPGQDLTQNNIRSWIVPSSEGVMYSGPEGTEELRLIKETTPPLDFQRQYEALPLEIANSAFRPEDVDASIGGNIETGPDGEQAYLMAIDIGRISDPSAWVMVKTKSRDFCQVVNAWVRPLGERHEMGSAEANRIARIYDCSTAIVDNTGGGTGGRGAEGETDTFAKYYRGQVQNVRPFYFTTKTKNQAIQDMMLAFEQKKIMIPPQLTELIKQIKDYRWEQKGHRLIFQGPGGKDDDLVQALSMALFAVRSGWWSLPKNKAATMKAYV